MPALNRCNSLLLPATILLAATLMAGCAAATTSARGVPSASHQVIRGDGQLSAGPAPVATGTANTHLSSGPGESAGKASQAPAGNADGAQGFPYPMDAQANAVPAALEVRQAGGAAQGLELQVTVPTGGWIAGQRVFLYVGSQYAATLPGPGSSGMIQVPSGLSGLVTVSGFQFPGNSPAAPIDAYGTAKLRVSG